MDENNILSDFFKRICNAVRLKLNTEELFTPKNLPSTIIERIDSSTSGSFSENLTCFLAGGVSEIKSVVISSTVTEIEGGAYQACSKLSNVVFLGNVTSIGGSAFRYCSSLESITLPDTVKSISTYTFQGCTNLREINVPRDIQSTDLASFSDTAWYNNQANNTAVYFGPILYKFKGDVLDENGKVDIKDGTIRVARALQGSATLKRIEGPVSDTIAMDAFEVCKALEEAKFYQKPGESIHLGVRAFAGRSNLRILHIDNIRSAEIDSLNACTSLGDIYLLNSDKIPLSLRFLSGLANRTPLVNIHVAPNMYATWKNSLDSSFGENSFNVTEYIKDE